jgi:mortality factor 4-like protein 1
VAASNMAENRDEALLPHPVPFMGEFQENDVVLAFHGELLYEAKILAVIGGPPADRYSVHYQGWKMSWEEEVPRDRVVEHTDINLRIAHELLRSAKQRQHARTVVAAAAPVPVPVEPAKKRSATDAALPADGADRDSNGNGVVNGAGSDGDDRSGDGGRAALPADLPADLPAVFELPAALKRQLVDDYENVVKEHRLVPLPKDDRMTVKGILKAWIEYRGEESWPVDRASKELAAALREYFDATLPTVLLYGFERQQFHDMFGPDSKLEQRTKPSAVYGCEHLLRLFVKLPFILSECELEPKIIAAIGEQVNLILRFLVRNGRTLFCPVYDDATPEYIERATRL